MAIEIVDTVRLAKTRRRRNKRLLEYQEELDRRAAKEDAALQKARQALYDEGLVLFRDAFQRLRGIDLVEPTAIERPTVGDAVDVVPQPQKGAATAAASALAGGALLVAGGVLLVVGGRLVAGYIAEAGTYRTVSTFGTASTGTPIKRLYGAAAHRATLARLGRGSVAAGGGGMAAGKRVLSEIHATAANVTQEAIVMWQVQALGHWQQEKEQVLERRETEMSEAQHAASALHEHSKDMQRVLQDLRLMLLRRLPSFTALVEVCDDFTQYDSCQRAEVAAMADLDGLAVMVMDCPIIDAEGRMTEVSRRVIADAEVRLRAMETKS